MEPEPSTAAELAKQISDAHGGAAVYICIIPQSLPQPVADSLMTLHHDIGALMTAVTNIKQEK